MTWRIYRRKVSEMEADEPTLVMELFKCCGPACPGYPFKASEYGHPSACLGDAGGPPVAGSALIRALPYSEAKGDDDDDELGGHVRRYNPATPDG